MNNQYKPGTLARHWHTKLVQLEETRERERTTDPALALTLYVPVVNRQSTPPPYEKKSLYHDPVIQTPPPAPRLPAYVMYSAVASPLTMLTGAVCEALRRYGRPPVQLFVSPILEPVLDRETEIVTQVKYDRHFRFYQPSSINKFKVIPVYLDKFLPDILRQIIGGTLNRETVVALMEY